MLPHTLMSDIPLIIRPPRTADRTANRTASQVPPLRVRTADIGSLATFYLSNMKTPGDPLASVSSMSSGDLLGEKPPETA